MPRPRCPSPSTMPAASPPRCAPRALTSTWSRTPPRTTWPAPLSAEEQHRHGVRLDLGLQADNGAGHVVLGGVLDHVDIKALGAQRGGEAAGIVDGLGQRGRGIRVMAVAD